MVRRTATLGANVERLVRVAWDGIFAWRGWPVIVDLGSPAAATHSSTSVWDQQFGRKTLCWWNGSLMFLGSFVSEDPLPIRMSQSCQFSVFQAKWQLYN